MYAKWTFRTVQLLSKYQKLSNMFPKLLLRPLKILCTEVIVAEDVVNGVNKELNMCLEHSIAIGKYFFMKNWRRRRIFRISFILFFLARKRKNSVKSKQILPLHCHWPWGRRKSHQRSQWCCQTSYPLLCFWNVNRHV